MDRKKDRVCVMCRHWILDLGEQNWSEVTPGKKAKMLCNKGHYRFYMGDGGQDAYVKAIESAKTCVDYERRIPA